MGSIVIAVRPPRLSDANAVAAVHEAAWTEAYRGILPGRELTRFLAGRGPSWWRLVMAGAEGMLVLEVGGKVAGYVTFGAHRRGGLEKRGEIHEIYLDPSHQGLGFGKRLFNAARDELRRRGRVGLVVWALAENERAERFYLGLGGRKGPRMSERWGGRRVVRVAYLWD